MTKEKKGKGKEKKTKSNGQKKKIPEIHKYSGSKVLAPKTVHMLEPDYTPKD